MSVKRGIGESDSPGLTGQWVSAKVLLKPDFN